MNIAAAVSAPVANIEAKSSINSDDVRQIQQMVLATPEIDPVDAETLLQLEKHCQEKDPAW